MALAHMVELKLQHGCGHSRRAQVLPAAAAAVTASPGMTSSTPHQLQIGGNLRPVGRPGSTRRAAAGSSCVCDGSPCADWVFTCGAAEVIAAAMPRWGEQQHATKGAMPAHTRDSCTGKTESSAPLRADTQIFSTGARLSVQNVSLRQAVVAVTHPTAPCFQGSPRLLEASPDQQEILQGLRGQQMFGQLGGDTIAHGP